MILLDWIKDIFKPENQLEQNDAVRDLMRWGNYIEVQTKYL